MSETSQPYTASPEPSSRPIVVHVTVEIDEAALEEKVLAIIKKTGVAAVDGTRQALSGIIGAPLLDTLRDS